jgi:hypothetical protein
MTTKSITSFLLFFILACLVHNQYAQSQTSKSTFRVKLEISGNDNIKTEVSSYLSRELRALNDVVLVDDNPHYLISIVAVEVPSLSGYKTGVNLSVVVLKIFPNKWLDIWIMKLPDASKKGILDYTSNLYYFIDHSTIGGSSDDLQSMCKKIVATFDNETLEEIQKNNQHWKDKVDSVMKNQKN